jgi:hypothetical protein
MMGGRLGRTVVCQAAAIAAAIQAVAGQNPAATSTAHLIASEEIAQLHGKPDFGTEFSRVLGAGFTDAGTVVVHSAREYHVDEFGLDGRWRRRVGSAGAGPGQFRAIGSVAPLKGDSLAIYDPLLRRITIYSARRRNPATHPLPGQTICCALSGLHLVHVAYLEGGDRAYALVARFNMPNQNKDLMRTFPRITVSGEPRFSISAGTPGSYAFRVFPKPFAVGALIGFIDSDVVVSDGAAVGYIRYHSDGSVARKVALANESARPPTIAESRQEVDRVIKSAASDPILREAARDSALKLMPALLPLVDRLIADRTGTVWLRRFLPTASAETWIRITADGRYGGQLTTPADTRLLAVNGLVLLLLSEDASTGIQQLRLRRYAIR